MKSKKFRLILGVSLSMFFVMGIGVAWFLNAQAGIAVWTSPEIQIIARAATGSTGNASCAVADNKVYCWGNTNTYGQLGTGDATTVSYIPRQVYDPNGVLVGKKITAIALANTGTVCVVASNVPYCWGRGQYGALGDGTTSDRYYPSAVTTSGVLAGKVITDIGAGDGHVCVVASGAAYCWGANGSGRIGDGSTTQRNTPVAVTTTGVLSGKTVTNIVAGSGFTCATASGAAYCWGDDTNGYLGNDSAYTNSLTPVAVDTSGILSGKTIKYVGAGQGNACALATDGTVGCWGSNSGGQLGNNSTTTSPTPVAIVTTGDLSGKTIATLRVGDARACVIDTSSKAYCWGAGPVGNGNVNNKLVPTVVTSSSTLNGMNIVQVAAGARSGNCFLNDQNRMYCTAANADGSLGNNTTNASSAPVQVLFTSTFNAPNYRLYANADSATPGSPLAGINTPVTLGSRGQTFRVRMGIKTTAQIGKITSTSMSSCGVSDGKVYCWGGNYNGQLGNNSTTDSLVPVAVSTSGVLSGKTILSISGGMSHVCAIASDNQAYCWGDNTYGQLGNNSTTQSNLPVAVNTSGVLSGKTILSISSGGYHTCAIASDNQAYCWGGNGSGQLGNNSTTDSLVPVAVSTSGVLSGKTILSVTSGDSHACAIASDNQAYCWGNNGEGALGNNSTTQSLVPVAVTTSGVLSGKTVLSISSGNSDTCAIASDNQAYCWGANWYGQLGNNSTTGSLVPVAVSTSGVLSGKTAKSITIDDMHTCLIASDNQAYCWGYNSNGQLGNNSTTDSLVPVAVSTSGVLSGKTVQSIAVASDFTCAIASDSQAYCWGYNYNGQLGNNLTATSTVPVIVLTDGYINGADINSSDNTYKLQYAQKTVGTCSAQTGFADVTSSTAIAFNTNSSVSNGAVITATINDPVPTANSVPQAYISASGTFTNTSTITGGKTGLWDFSLKDSSGTYSTTYCLRMTYGDGTAIEGTVQYPEITTSAKKDVAAAPYRFYQNANSLMPGTPLGFAGQSATLTSSGQAFRLRTGILGVTKFLKIATGSSHTCAIGQDNLAYCWGWNSYGQLGINSTISYTMAETPVDTSGVLSGKTVSAISTGLQHTCAIASDNQAYCWGYNSTGQLGNNSTTQSSVPVAVDTSGVFSGKTILSLTAGNTHNCAIASDNQAYCWGNGGNGRLGTGSGAQSNVPVAVTTTGVLSGKTILSIAAGASHTCAIASDNQAYCWGWNQNGYLGNNSTTTSYVPVAVDTSGALSGKTVSSIVSNYFHTCALVSTGQAYCWGNNGSGQLGNGTSLSYLSPVQVVNYISGTRVGVEGKTVTAISTGTSHACAIVSTGQAYCWGYNSSGQLGSTTSSTNSALALPVDTSGVLSGKTILAISNGMYHTCAIASDNQAYCWGMGDSGKLGNNSTADSATPVAVDTTGVLSGKTILSIATSPGPSCVVASDNNGYCWGSGGSGQLGNNSTANSLVPTAIDTSGVLSGKTLRSITLGFIHTCAIASDGNAYCWGTNTNGQLGNNSTTQSLVPTAVTTSGVLSGKTILAISNGMYHTCVIASDNQAYCWGVGGSGRLGDNATPDKWVPTAVTTTGVLAGKTILSISAGNNHTCVIASDNQAYCWGANGNGQLGNNSTTQSLVPVAVDTSGVLAGKTILSIDAGSNFTCALASDNQTYCWGANSNGQLGDGSFKDSLVPTLGYKLQYAAIGSLVSASTNTYTLQYAVKSATTCSAQTTGFADVTASTPIAYNTNASVTSGTTIATTANDPLGSTQTTALTYISSAGSFTNASDIAYGTMGMWDFSLKDNGAPYNTSYCLRVGYSDGTALTTTQSMPEVKTTTGTLSVGFVDSLGSSLSAPTTSLGSVTATTMAAQTATGTLGTSSQKLRVFNDIATNGWSVSVAATNGPTALWNRTDNLAKYDFNDTSGGGTDGGDTDLLGGALTLFPNNGSIASPFGCGTTGLSLGSQASFNEGSTDSITLFSATSAATMGCAYDLTNVGISQVIPAAQASGTYTLDMTVTVVAL